MFLVVLVVLVVVVVAVIIVVVEVVVVVMVVVVVVVVVVGKINISRNHFQNRAGFQNTHEPKAQRVPREVAIGVLSGHSIGQG